MELKTYLHESFKQGRLMRWTFMPLNVYISPMKFYSKQGQNHIYQSMVIKACEEWERACPGVQFKLVDNILSSNINVEWRRIDRKAFGHCQFNYDKSNRLYGAEVSIGLSDGVICQQYMAEGEVYHTILHEFGHALGLGHSPYDTDIMYTPHKYGVVSLSPRDKTTIQWLYKLNQGTTVNEMAAKYKISSQYPDEIVTKYLLQENPSEFEKVKGSLMNGAKKDLLTEQTNIADLKKYNLSLQNIQLSDNVMRYLGKKGSKD
ncbi:matrixin family metalloprotease [bacterium]|nr:matrixin family metalloprotease [bacterium]